MIILLAACSKAPALDSSVSKLVFKTLTGEQIHMQDNKGPILINFWATDCAVCLHEMPELAELYRDYQDKGFNLIAVAMPYDPPNRVLEMTQSRQWPFPVALDIQGEALASFATVKGTPTSFLIDGNGNLVKRYVGAISLDSIRQQLDSLLGLS